MPDGRTIVFGNGAIVIGVADYRDGRGICYGRGEAVVAKATLVEPGRIELVDRKLVAGLTGLHGIDILPVATGELPAGTAFMTQDAGPQTVRGSGSVLPKSGYMSNLMAFDPAFGKVLGRLPLGRRSALALRFRDLEQPNGLAINRGGDIYAGDMAPASEVPGWTSVSPSAFFRIPHASIDRMMFGGPGSADAADRIITPGKTNGLPISHLDGSLLSVSCFPTEPVNGGIYRYVPDDFVRGRQPAPIIAGLGIIDRIRETQRGTIAASTPITSKVHLFPPDGRHLIVKLADGSNPVARPADINVCYPSCLEG